MASKTNVNVEFETTSSEKFFHHKGKQVPLVGGKGSFQTETGKSDLVLFGLVGSPGTKAKITLTVAAPAELQIEGHPIEGKVAVGKSVWGDSRFFRVR